MTSPATHPPSPLAPIADGIWVGVPLAVRRVSAGLAVATVDGLYLAVRPIVGLVAPLVALLFGFAVGALHPGFEIVFTEALWLLVVVAVVGTLSGAVGLYLTVGFALGDLAFGDHPLWDNVYFGDSAVEAFLARYGALLLSYLLMGMLAVGVPIAAKSLAAEFMLPVGTPRALRAVVGLGAVIVITGLLVYVWLQSAPLLVRPVFVWLGSSPTVAAIAPIQETGTRVVVFAVLAAIVRSVVQLVTAMEVGRQHAPSRLDALEQRFATAEPVVPLLSRLPLVVRLVIRAALLTLVLSGLYAAYWHAALTFGVLLAAQFLASLLGRRAESGYAKVVNRVPRLIRLLIVIVPVYLAGTVVLGYFLEQGTLSFMPFLILTIVSAVLMSLLSPARPEAGAAR